MCVRVTSNKFACISEICIPHVKCYGRAIKGRCVHICFHSWWLMKPIIGPPPVAYGLWAEIDRGNPLLGLRAALGSCWANEMLVKNPLCGLLSKLVSWLYLTCFEILILMDGFLKVIIVASIPQFLFLFYNRSFWFQILSLYGIYVGG
jgi:hypothetical protein